MARTGKEKNKGLMSIRLEENVAEYIEERAKNEYRTINNMVMVILTEYVNQKMAEAKKARKKAEKAEKTVE